jgi:hypothetical protein
MNSVVDNFQLTSLLARYLVLFCKFSGFFSLLVWAYDDHNDTKIYQTSHALQAGAMMITDENRAMRVVCKQMTPLKEPLCKRVWLPSACFCR